MIDWWDRVDEIMDRVEQTLLVTSLGVMILIAFSQIVLRNFFSTGLSWGELLLRNLVLWIGFIGAAIATREGKHINIDVLSRWLPSNGKNIVNIVTHLFSLSICGLLTYAALKFIKNEAQMGNLTIFNIPAWIPEIILPVTFGVMTFRFSFGLFKHLAALKSGTIHERKNER